MHPASNVSTFLLSGVGAIPLTEDDDDDFVKSKSRKKPQIQSPLGVEMADWHGVQNDNRSQLPGNVYCVYADLDKSRMNCEGVTVWTDANATDIQASAPGWKNVNPELDVTLVMTLQINEAQSSDTETLKAIVGHLVDNIERWYGQPSVTVIFMTGATEQSVQYLSSMLSTSFRERNDNALIAAIYEQTDLVVSRKALVNMALDAAPTRWHVSGLELERGLILSNDAAFLATRAVAANGASRGNVFWMMSASFSRHKTRVIFTFFHILKRNARKAHL